MIIALRLNLFLLVVLLSAPTSRPSKSIRERIQARESIWMQS